MLAKCGPSGGAPSGGAVSLISQLPITWTPLSPALDLPEALACYVLAIE